MCIELGMPSNHLILCRPLLLLSSLFPSIRVFSNESVLLIRWPKYWSFSFSISPYNEYSGLISFRMDWFDLLEIQGTLKSLLQHHSSKASILWCSAFFMIQLSHPYIVRPIDWSWCRSPRDFALVSRLVWPLAQCKTLHYLLPCCVSDSFSPHLRPSLTDLQALISALSLLWSDRKTTVGSSDIWDGLHIDLVEEDPEVCRAEQLGPSPQGPCSVRGLTQTACCWFWLKKKKIML